MAEREDNVYKAKLAEQAERYDGKKTCRKNQDFMVSFMGVDFFLANHAGFFSSSGIFMP